MTEHQLKEKIKELLVKQGQCLIDDDRTEALRTGQQIELTRAQLRAARRGEAK